MRYRQFGRLEWQVSVLALGVPFSNSPADPGLVEDVVCTAINRGVNFLVVGYPYDESKRSFYEALVRAFQNGCRTKVRVAAALPSLLVSSAADLDRYLDEQLKALRLDRVDFCLLDGLNRHTWPRMEALGVLDWIEKAKAARRFDHVGFAFHDHFQVLRDIVEAHPEWSFCLFQYSFMDVDHHPGTNGVKYAAQKGLAVITSKPLRDGRLTRRLPGPVAELWARAGAEDRILEWGLSWVWDHPEVSSVIGDITTREELDRHLAAAGEAEPGRLGVDKLLVMSQIRDIYRKLRPIQCPACRGCMPCPEDIEVPRIFELYNDAIIYDDAETAQYLYRIERHALERCTECGQCAQACPRHIPIPRWLEKARAVLAREGL
ncbi:MAG: aldo/keto reductase [Moorellales bacterium]